MRISELINVIEYRKNWIDKTLLEKNKEYAGERNVFKNFYDGSKFTGLTPEQTLWSYLTKHLVSIKDLIDNPEKITQSIIDEKIGDVINYLILLDGLLNENKTN